MPERSGHLHQISQAIGRLEGAVEGIDKYVHEREHSIANLAQKVDGLGPRIAKDMAGVEGRLEAKLDQWKREVDGRLTELEKVRERQSGAKNLAVAFLQSPVIAWLFAIAVVAWTAIKGGGK